MIKKELILAIQNKLQSNYNLMIRKIEYDEKNEFIKNIEEEEILNVNSIIYQLINKLSNLNEILYENAEQHSSALEYKEYNNIKNIYKNMLMNFIELGSRLNLNINNEIEELEKELITK